MPAETVPVSTPAPATGPLLGRRTVFAATGAAAVVAACAACGASSSASSTAPASVAAGTVLAKASDVPASTGLVTDGPSGKVLLAHKNGAVVAHSAVCTHQGGIVDGTGKCPLHGSQFDITTGAVQNGPATAPLAAISVTETGGNVVTA